MTSQLVSPGLCALAAHTLWRLPALLRRRSGRVGLGIAVGLLGFHLAQPLIFRLGDARFADYTRETIYDYQQLKRLTERANLPVEIANRAYALRDTIAQQSNRIFDDASLADEQKRTALQSLAQEVRAQLLATLGQVVGPAYVKTVDNQWLNNVERGAAVKFTGISMTTSNGNAVISFGGGPDFRNLPRSGPPSRPDTIAPGR